MNVNDILYGFQITNRRESSELNGTLWEMRHIKTGAQLVWLDNKESNMVFSVAFKTLPHDDTGVFHILEHSVLCGSDNYPVKEPFLDLLKSSMNTFLNAMTFSDKTLYPVSSRNEQDYLNLAGVYLDAVFFPSIYKNPSIFHQEGWHYELSEDDSQAIYKGVVFNEMKGAVSSVDRQLNYGICRMLFPDNCYQYVSGGDPEYIPELSYEQFITAHRDFYNPTNAKIYLDGNVPIHKILPLISEGYLDKFEYSEATHEIKPQKPVSARSEVRYYAIGKDEPCKNKTQMVHGKILSHWSDRKKTMALSVLGAYLADTNESPLKRAVLESGLAQDMSIYVDDSVLQPYSVLHIRNTEYEHRDALCGIIRTTASELIEKGLEKDELRAILSQYEFALREEQEPRGIIRNINALNSWLHDGDPLLYLENDAILAELRYEIDTGYYEALLRELLLDNEHTAELFLVPSNTKGDEDMAKEQKRLADALSALNEQQKQEIRTQNAELEKWQCSADTPEALATLPVLSLSDVSDKPEWLDTVSSEKEGVRVLFHPLSSNGVVHLNLYFSVADQSVENLRMLSFISELFGELPTAKYTAAQLQRMIKQYIGTVDYSIKAFPVKGSSTSCKPYFVVSLGVLEVYIKEACSLICEILKETDYTCDAQIRELLLQRIESYNRRFISEGHSYAVKRAQSNFSASAFISENVSGYDYFCYLRQFKDDFEKQLLSLRTFAQNIPSQIFGTHRLLISETALAPHSELCIFIDELRSELDRLGIDTMTVDIGGQPKREAILIPSAVSYAAFCGNLNHYGKSFDGSLPVLSTILSFGYLWSEIRVRGGAYGCGFKASESGELLFYSYRDPSPLRSLQIYRDTAEFIRRFVSDDEGIEKYIISTISSAEPLMAPSKRGQLADNNFLCDISYEDKVRIREQMLSLKKDDLLLLCELFEQMADGNAVCIFGSEAALSEEKDSFTVFSL